MVEILWESELEQSYNKKAILHFSDCVGDVCGIDMLSTVSIVFTSNEKIAVLNSQYRNKEGSTDILSFAFSEEGLFWPEPVKNSLSGEIFISTDMLYSNAIYFGVSEEEELKRLLIHGFLHIIGYDHATNEDSEPMLKLQEKILDGFRFFLLKN